MKRNYSNYKSNRTNIFRQSRGYARQSSSIPKQVAWLTKQQKISMGKEMADRNYVTYGINSTVDSTGNIISMTNISVGTGLGSRKDLKIKLSTLQYRFILSAADTVNTLRVLVVQAKNANTGSPSDYFRSSSGGTALGYSEQANTENCYVLADHIIHSGSEQASCEGKITKFPVKTLTYNTTLGNGITQGGIYICLWSDSQIASHPSVAGFGKLKYFD